MRTKTYGPDDPAPLDPQSWRAGIVAGLAQFRQADEAPAPAAPAMLRKSLDAFRSAAAPAPDLAHAGIALRDSFLTFSVEASDAQARERELLHCAARACLTASAQPATPAAVAALLSTDLGLAQCRAVACEMQRTGQLSFSQVRAVVAATLRMCEGP